jgi:hypothetical protein
VKKIPREKNAWFGDMKRHDKYIIHCTGGCGFFLVKSSLVGFGWMDLRYQERTEGKD